MAQRIQRLRTNGWRMPDGAIYVGRPTKFGNPFVLRQVAPIPPQPKPMWAVVYEGVVLVRWDTKDLAATDAVDRFRRLMREPWADRPAERELIASLRGKDLACWCPLDQPCHADVLLDLANERQTPACAICRMQRGTGLAHWAWHAYCQAELNPIALVARLDAMPQTPEVQQLRAYVLTVTGMDVEGARRAMLAEMRT